MSEPLDKYQKAEVWLMRFAGRRDSYGIKHYFINKEGVENSAYRKVKESLTPEVALKHIDGHDEIMVYVNQSFSQISFGAFDFDCKYEGKPDGYYWSHVKRVSDVLTEWKVPHHLARSSTFGFHIYFFFDKPSEANRFRAFAMEVLKESGLQRETLEGRLMPDGSRIALKAVEIYPKGSFVGELDTGTGIKPPMIEKKFADGRNCFIDRDNHLIGRDEDDIARAQWRYLDNALHVTHQIDNIIEQKNILVNELGPLTSQRRDERKPFDARDARGAYEDPTGGAIEKTLAACPAFRDIHSRVKAGDVLGHEEGFALWHLAINVKGGEEWFRKNVAGWGETLAQDAQLEHSKVNGYRAWSCNKMKANGVCKINGECLKPQPTRENQERSDPESLWPSPSPKRYAFGNGEELLDDLKAEAAGVCDIEDEQVKADKLKDLFIRAQVFDALRKIDFETYVKKLKPFQTAKATSVIAKDAAATHVKEENKKKKTGSDYEENEGNAFIRIRPYGYAILKENKEHELVERVLTNVTIDIKEDRASQDSDGTIVERLYLGTCSWEGNKRSFKISTKKWGKSEEFYNTFSEICGSAFFPNPTDYTYIRQASLAFSKESMNHTTYVVTQGFSGDTYLMPSVAVNRDGIERNDSKMVDLSGIPVARNLDFSIVSDEDFSALLKHITTDFLPAWPTPWTYTGMAHIFLPVIKKVMPFITWTPILYYEGLTGSGKSALTKAFQQFYGSFDSLQTFEGSWKSLAVISYSFKDAVFIIDDYKGISAQQVSVLRHTIQYSYEPNSAPKLNADGSLKQEKPYRAVLIMSGEKMVDDSSIMARTINIETHKQDFLSSSDKYQAVLDNMENYKAITPRFIKWAMGDLKEDYRDTFKKAYKEFITPFKLRQNAPRLAQNLATNYMSWAMVCDFFLEFAAISPVECEEMKEKHMKMLMSVMDRMLILCNEGQESTKFSSYLVQTLRMGKAVIAGLPGYDTGADINRNAYRIGFLKKNSAGKRVACLIPEVTIEAVQSAFRTQQLELSNKVIGRQWRHEGVICEYENDRNTKGIKVGGAKTPHWVVDLELLGLPLHADATEDDENEDTVFQRDDKPAQVLKLKGRSEGAERDKQGIY